MQNYVQPGDHLTIPAAPYALVPGDGAVAGAIFGIASGAADIGAEVVLVTMGVFTLAKVSALAIAVGDIVYWDSATKLVTKTAGGNMKIGVAISVAPNPSAVVNVRLNGSF